MTEIEGQTSRKRGPSARGDFQNSKDFAMASEAARVIADKKKATALREARQKLERERSVAKQT